MCRISKIITFLESLRQAGWFDLFESGFFALLIFDPLITLWGNFDAPYLKLLNDASVASACFYVRTCRRVRNGKKIATIRDFHLPGSFLCLSTRLLREYLFQYLNYLTNFVPFGTFDRSYLYIKVHLIKSNDSCWEKFNSSLLCLQFVSVVLMCGSNTNNMHIFIHLSFILSLPLKKKKKKRSIYKYWT